MKYILDTNIFRKLLDHFPKKGQAFITIWEKLDEGIDDGSFVSVDECFNEMSNHYSVKTDNYEWIKQRKKMFLNPTNEESLIIKKLFENPKMQESITFARDNFVIVKRKDCYCGLSFLFCNISQQVLYLNKIYVKII